MTSVPGSIEPFVKKKIPKTNSPKDFFWLHVEAVSAGDLKVGHSVLKMVNI